MHRIRNIISGVVSAFFAYLLWWLQMIQDPTVSSYENNTIFSTEQLIYFWENRIFVGGVIFALVILSIILNYFLWYQTPRKKWLKEYMRHIIKEEFAGNFGSTRITVFKVQNGWRLWFSYMLKVLILNFRPHKRCGIVGIHLSNAPSWGKKHLKIYSRCSKPNEKGSSTFFTIPNNKEEAFGVASMCCYTQRIHKVETEHIANINISKVKFEDCTKANMDKIKKYAKANFMLHKMQMDKKTYDKMRCIHRLSNKHYVQPIFTQDDIIWGVFVVDIDNETTEQVFNEDICDKMTIVADTIALSLNYIK